MEDKIVNSEGYHQVLLPSHEELLKAEKDLNGLLMLKQYLAGIRDLHNALESADCRSNLLVWIRQKLSPEHLGPVIRLVEENLEEDATFSKSPIDIRNNRLWAIKV